MNYSNIIDFIDYRKQVEALNLASDNSMPEDLVTAIQLLIQSLREAKPLKNIG